MSTISNIVIRVSRMITVDKVGKNEQVFKCCEQSAQNEQSGQGG